MRKTVIILFPIILFFCCKERKTDNSNLNEKNNDSIVLKEDFVISKRTQYRYKYKEGNDSQEIIIIWLSEFEFEFEIIVDTDICVLSDKGKAMFYLKERYKTLNHPIIKILEFNNKKTSVKLICDYSNNRDECDPIEEFIMTKRLGQ